MRASWLRLRNKITFLHAVCLLGIMETGGLVLSCTASAADRKTSEEANGELRSVLRDVLDGRDSSRAAALEDLRLKRPNDEAVHWQSGYVHWKNQWIRFDELSKDPLLQEKLANYEKQRMPSTDTAADQLRLADWCRTQRLAEQERAHLLRVLTLQPNHDEARARLRWKRIGGIWIKQDDLDTAKRQSMMASKAGRDAASALKRAIAASGSSQEADRRKAEQLLLELDDPALIPTILSEFDNASDDTQAILVNSLDRIKTPSASLALARIAVTNPYDAIGESAAQALRSRPLYDFVPALLSLMSTPVETLYVVQQLSNDRLIYQQIFVRATESHKVQLVVGHSLRQDEGRINAAQVQQLTNFGQDRTKRLADVNANLANVNECVATVLNVATKQNLPATPDTWWKWWYEINELISLREKPTFTRIQYSTESVINAKLLLPGTEEGYRLSCLVAGTPVWTITGLKAVEKFQVGDLVLAQNPDTGELAYKAVIMPTKRPAAPVLRIETEKDVIRATGGHHFWVAGEGWRRARSLQAGQRLHDVQGTSTIRSVTEEKEPLVTYNLVVDGFHTYFVGEGKVLSHDNTIPNATAAKVPGLAEETKP